MYTTDLETLQEEEPAASLHPPVESREQVLVRAARGVRWALMCKSKAAMRTAPLNMNDLAKGA